MQSKWVIYLCNQYKVAHATSKAHIYDPNRISKWRYYHDPADVDQSTMFDTVAWFTVMGFRISLGIIYVLGQILNICGLCNRRYHASALKQRVWMVCINKTFCLSLCIHIMASKQPTFLLPMTFWSSLPLCDSSFYCSSVILNRFFFTDYRKMEPMRVNLSSTPERRTIWTTARLTRGTASGTRQSLRNLRCLTDIENSCTLICSPALRNWVKHTAC